MENKHDCHYGTCHICLKEKTLTFEHFPPKSCFNNGTVKIGEKLQQKGLGAYTLCADCNNLTGKWYVPEYKKFVHIIGLILNQNKSSFATDKDKTAIFITIKDIIPLFVAKQILVIMASQMPIDLLMSLQFNELLLNKYSYLDGTEDFTLLVGISDDYEKGYLFQEPVKVNGTDKAFCFDCFPLRFILVLEKNYNASGFASFNPLLESPGYLPIDYEFIIGYKNENALTDIEKDFQ